MCLCSVRFVLCVFACFLGMCVYLVMLYLSLFLAATSTRLWCGPPTLCLLHLQPITWQGNAPISCLWSVSCDCACHFGLPLIFFTFNLTNFSLPSSDSLTCLTLPLDLSWTGNHLCSFITILCWYLGHDTVNNFWLQKSATVPVYFFSGFGARLCDLREFFLLLCFLSLISGDFFHRIMGNVVFK